MYAKWIDELEKANTTPEYDDDNLHYSADDNPDRDEDLEDYSIVCSNKLFKENICLLI